MNSHTRYPANAFRWLNKQGVESKDGYSVQRSARFHYEYREGEQCITVIVEPGLEYEELFVRPESKWDGGTSVSVEKLEEIRSRIASALTFMGIRHKFA